MMKNTKNYLLTFFRIMAGSVFIFSGFVKGVDPTGSVIKFEEYLQAFHLDFLGFLVLPVAFGLPLVEFLTGISLLFRYKIRWGVVSFLLFMLVFTPLTFILALFNPVSDCGCFGDALVITNWQTFWKNVILLAFAVMLYLNRKRIKTPHTFPVAWPGLGFFALLFLFVSTHSYRHLPLIDFRPYHVGVSIPEDRKVPEGAREDEYETTLVYEKDGVQKEFSMDNFPWQDSTWTFVEQRSKLIHQGDIPPIHDFDIILPTGENITDQVLSDPGYTFLLISSDINQAAPAYLRQAFNLSVAAADHATGFYLLTSSGDRDLKAAFSASGTSFPYANTDETTLKTIIRSNPGLLLIHDGVILRKWSRLDLPGPDIFDHSLLSGAITSSHQGRNTWLILCTAGFILLWGMGVVPLIGFFSGRNSA